PATIGLLLQVDLGKDVDRSGQAAKLHHGVIARDDPGASQPPHALERRPRRQPDCLRQLLDGGAAVALQGGENPDVDTIECGRALGGHEYLIASIDQLQVSSTRKRGSIVPRTAASGIWVPAFA